MTARQWLGVVALWTFAVWIVALKTGRGQAWDAQQSVTTEWKRANANAEALALWSAGAARDSLGFWH